MTALLFVHAFPLDGSMWDVQVASLREEVDRILAPSLPGFGGTPVPAAQPSLDDLDEGRGSRAKLEGAGELRRSEERSRRLPPLPDPRRARLREQRRDRVGRLSIRRDEDHDPPGAEVAAVATTDLARQPTAGQELAEHRGSVRVPRWGPRAIRREPVRASRIRGEDRDVLAPHARRSEQIDRSGGGRVVLERAAHDHPAGDVGEIRLDGHRDDLTSQRGRDQEPKVTGEDERRSYERSS